LYAAETVQKL